MHKGFLIRYLAFLALMMTVSACWAGPRDLSIAEVHVYRQQLADKVRYTYVVTNKGTGLITGLEVGFDYYHGEPELQGAQPLRVAGPPGWESQVVGLEESNYYSISWDSGTAAIQPGQTRAGFIVETSAMQQQLVASHWTVIVDGPVVAASDLLVAVEGPVPGDTLPPLLNVAASPARIWPPNGNMVNVNVSVSVSDDSDPTPIVKLLSVGCSECGSDDTSGAVIGTDDRSFYVRAERLGKTKTGRVYLVKYQASDSAGNVATDTTEIVVPHDERK